MNAGRPFTTGDVAKILGCAHRTAAKIIDRGQLKGYRLPGGDRRVCPEEMVRFLKDWAIPLERLELASAKHWK